MIKPEKSVQQPKELHSRMKKYTSKMKQKSEKRTPPRSFERKEKVYVYNHVGKQKWIAGSIHTKISDRTYEIDIGHRKIKRHIDDIIPRKTTEEVDNDNVKESDDSWMYACSGNVTNNRESTRRSLYPTRARRPVDRYGMVTYT